MLLGDRLMVGQRPLKPLILVRLQVPQPGVQVIKMKNTPSSSHNVIVIGGGAAGMMAAGRVAERGKSVLLLERNKRLGEKLRISGGGRCNITNAEINEKKLLAHYGKGEQFLYSAFSQFGVKETFSFFESRGLPLKVEKNNRVFPQTEKAADVVRVLEEYLKKGGVEVQKNARVERIETDGSRITGIIAGGITHIADSYIFSTGGLSHAETGSTGDGFAWLAKMNHIVEKPSPTIVPLKVKEPWAKNMPGKSVSDAKITFFVDGKKKFSKTGTILFTHFGISGPTILNAAKQVGDLLQEGTVSAIIDLYPKMDLGILDRHITKVFEHNKNKALRNAFKEIAPAGVAQGILSLLPDIDIETKVHSVLKEDRHKLAQLSKNLPLTIEGLMGFERAVVADGGVVLSDIDMRTMRSKKFENLYVVGDLLHITRPSGGYSLQLCWTTGYVAGSSV